MIINNGSLDQMATKEDENQINDSPLRFLNLAGYDRAKEIGIPHKSHEMFTYVDTNLIVEKSLSLKNGSSSELNSFLNNNPQLPVKALSLADAVNKNNSLLDRLIYRAKFEKDFFTSLHDYYVNDGIYLSIPPKGSASETVKVNFQNQDAKSGKLKVSHPRLVIEVEDHATLSLEISASNLPKDRIENGVVDIIAGYGASVDLAILQNSRDQGYRLNSVRVEQAGESKVTATVYSTGSQLTRNVYQVSMTGDNARFEIRSLNALSGKSSAHTWARVKHIGKNCESEMLFRNIVIDESHASTDATAMVVNGAKGAVSRQLVNNLLLSNSGRANTKPALMIFDDDVVCSHGTTIGQLSEDEINYLGMRGIPKKMAERVLIEAFAEEVIRNFDSQFACQSRALLAKSLNVKEVE